MSSRQLLLYGGFALCLLWVGGEWAYRRFYEDPLKERNNRTADLNAELKKKSDAKRRATRARKQLDTWEQQSLPSDVEIARSLYREWLVQRVNAAGFQSPNVDSGSPVNRRGLFQSLSFSLRGRASLDKVTRFLFDFYQAKHLHQVQSISLTPIAGTPQLDVSLSIEALVLPNADRKEKLAEGPLESWAKRDSAEFRTIAQRNLFAMGGVLDPAALTFLSGVVSVDGRPQAWFDLRASNQTVKLSVGQKLEVGQFEGTVVRIEEDDVTLESEGEHWVISVGESLAQATAVPQLEKLSAGK